LPVFDAGDLDGRLETESKPFITLQMRLLYLSKHHFLRISGIPILRVFCNPSLNLCSLNASNRVQPVKVTQRKPQRCTKIGGLQRQGVKGEAVVIYRKPLTTPDLKPSGFPEG